MPDNWKDRLTPEQYHITREGGTERAFSGTYYRLDKPGIYHCVCCHASLFQAQQKYDSGSGWPSFWAPIDEGAVRETLDNRHSMSRTEVRCTNCDAHLGHVFNDGPPPTGLRYCINSLSLEFIATDE